MVLQQGRGIPGDVLAKAPVSPWAHDVRDFVAPAVPVDTPTRAAGLGLLAGCGTVLDVGCGGGDAAFALVDPARPGVTFATGVDQQQDMLDLFAEGAVQRGMSYRTVLGRWPDAAAEAGQADVVTSNHVLHNVVDLPPFIAALTAAARRGVVVEMLAEHPMAWLDPLWVRFHGLHRPQSATDADALAVLVEMGLEVTVTRWSRQRRLPHDPAWVTQRLCLPRERADEVAAAMAEIPPRTDRAATLVWRV